MNKKLLQKAIAILSVIVAVGVLTAFGATAIAIAIALLLVGQLIATSISGSKSDAQLSYRANLLTKPLQEIYSNLDLGLVYVEQSIRIFDVEIEHRALLEVLRRDAPELVKSITELKRLVNQIRKEPYTDDEAVKLLGKTGFETEIEYGSNHVQAAVVSKLITNSLKIQDVVSEIKLEIQRLLAKYGGV